MSGGGSAFLEPSLIDLSLKKVRGCSRHLGHNSLLKNLGHVGPHHDWSDVLELGLVLSLVFGEGYQSPLVEVLRDVHGAVQESEDLS